MKAGDSFIEPDGGDPPCWAHLDDPSASELPAGYTLERTTPQFDEASVPAGLLRAHRVAPPAWGRLIVASGGITFVFEDNPDAARRVEAGGHMVIPPNRPHHLEIDGPVSFAVEFYVAGD